MQKILLAITGSISAYKMVDLAKELKKEHEVKVLLSESAKNFIKTELLDYFNIEYYSSEFQSKGIKHIDLARWATHFVICPATANTINKISQGFADNLITSVALSLKNDVVKIIVPAMNTEMLNNRNTQKSLIKLEEENWNIIHPDVGVLACGEDGEGKLPSIPLLKDIIPTFNNKIKSKSCLITAGATISPIDAFRYITNPSKGGTAYLMALEALKQGFKVHIIKGVNVIKEFEFLLKNPNCTMETVITTQDLLNAVKRNFEYKTWDCYLSPMAVGDISIKNTKKDKIKKKDMKTLEIEVNPDVLQYVVENKSLNLKIVGFAAESSITKEILAEKLSRKPVDLLVANLANNGYTGGEKKGFNASKGTYVFIKNNVLPEVINNEELDKKEMVKKIFKEII